GGITSELAIGTALWIVPRSRDGLGSRIVRAVGALIVHATWYLATAAWYGYGDGRILFELLGSWRLIVALGAGTLGCAAGSRCSIAVSRPAIRGLRCGEGLWMLCTPGFVLRRLYQLLEERLTSKRGVRNLQTKSLFQLVQ